MFDARNWYWIVGDDGAIYSSSRNCYVTPDDQAYLAWQQHGRSATPIGSQAELLYYVKDSLPEWLAGLPNFARPGPESYSAEQLIAYVADARYRAEIRGVVVASSRIATDRQSQAMINGAVAYLAAQSAGSTIRWKTAGGVWIDVDLQGVTAVAVAVGSHVQSMFAIEEDVVAAVKAGTTTTLEQIDAAFT